MQDYIISRFNSFSLDTKGLSVINLSERIKKDFQHVEDSKTLVVCLPGWGQELKTWNRVKREIIRQGASFLIFEFPREILSDQYKLTKECFEKINETVREDIKKLKEKYNFTRCILITVSLASSYGSMIYEENTLITDVVLIVPGENLARDMWYGCRTQHIKSSYEKQGIILDTLENFWTDLASENNMPAERTRISMYYGKKDKVIPYKYSIGLMDALVTQGFEVRSKSSQFLGHYVSIFHFLLFPRRFIRKALDIA